MTAAESPFLLLFLSGLAGGFGHCLGMCGPVVAAVSLSRPDPRSLRPHLLYHLGRILTYSLLGGAAAAAGSLAVVSVPIRPIQKGILAATGVAIILTGLSLSGLFGGRFRGDDGGDLPRPFSRLLRMVTESRGPGAFLPLGLLLGLIPCGLVYTALLTAAGIGMGSTPPAAAFLRGFSAMALFGLGTAPSLLLLGKAVGILGARRRLLLYRAAAALMVLAGILFVAKGLSG
ncbi:MAG: sulfite exporter TauE/SafE family protein [Deltaproteobacteria bacterium]